MTCTYTYTCVQCCIWQPGGWATNGHRERPEWSRICTIADRNLVVVLLLLRRRKQENPCPVKSVKSVKLQLCMSVTRVLGAWEPYTPVFPALTKHRAHRSLAYFSSFSHVCVNGLYYSNSNKPVGNGLNKSRTPESPCFWNYDPFGQSLHVRGVGRDFDLFPTCFFKLRIYSVHYFTKRS